MSSENQPRPMVFGYARISTTEQDESLQLDALHAAGCDRLMIDRASGAAAPSVRRWRRCSTGSGPATPSWSGGSTASAAACGT